ncbi:MAG: hypothetical protein MJY92_02420 [Bacteroidales bacterium]|nr:hypothetical protein [Bacteroidales bacterium]
MVQVGNQADTLELFRTSFESILLALDSIYVQEDILFLPDAEHPKGKYSKKEINHKLDSFQQLIERQKKRIDSLEVTLRRDESELSSLGRLIGYLRNNIELKETEISKMKKELQSSKANVAKLSGQVKTMTQTIDQLEEDNKAQLEILQAQDAALNEGYVYMASQKEFLKSGISNFFKKDMSKIDLSQATKVDIRYFLEVTIPSKNAKSLSSMPKGSYTLEKAGGETILKISNPASFWSVSNVLVVQY